MRTRPGWRALGVALRTWAVAYFKRMAERCERLEERLGREPTEHERAEHLGYARDA